MKHNLEKTTEWILVHEGGYVNHPKDPGGATNYGVIQRTYNAWRGRKGLKPRSVKLITMKEVSEIYREQYWDKVWGDHLPDGLDYAVYDFAINSGPERAVKFLQELLGVKVDGVLGNITLSAIRAKNNIEALIMDLCFKRWEWLKRLRHYKTFGKGWTRRVMGEMEGFQERDHGVIDRAVMLNKHMSYIPAPKDLKDGSGQRTVDEKLKRTETIKEGFNFDNLAKITIGSIPAWLASPHELPQGTSENLVMLATVFMGMIVLVWMVKKLR